MRILQLNLERYGHFTDASIVLPEDAPVCLLLGRNEAGKSTTLAALCDLLFGFAERASYHFLHQATSLRVGGRLRRVDGSEIQLRRRRGRKNTLLDGEDRPLPDEVILPFLGGIGRAQFERVFGVDQDRLRQGGTAMLASDGAVGALLLEAGEGLKDLVGVQRRLLQRLEALHKLKRNQGTETARIETSLKDVRERLRASQLSAEEWGRILETEREAVAELERLREQQRRTRARSSRLARIAQTKPVLRQIDEFESELAALDHLPELDADFEERRQEALAGAARWEMLFDAARDELDKIDRRIRDAPSPDAVLRFQKIIEGFAEARGAIEKARRDRPRREMEARQAGEALRRLAAELGFDSAADLRTRMPDALQRGELGDLVEEGGRWATAAALAAEQLEKATAALARLGVERLRQETDTALDPRPLQRRFEQLRNLVQDMDALRAVRAELEADEERLGRDVAALPLWQESSDKLANCPVPLRATIERCVDDAARRSEQRRLLEAGLAEADVLIEQSLRAISELAAEGTVPTSAQATRLRSWRSSTSPRPNSGASTGAGGARPSVRASRSIRRAGRGALGPRISRKRSRAQRRALSPESPPM